MGTSAQGEDRSNFQRVSAWAPWDFGFAKATEGTTFKDATFAANWANMGSRPMVRGAYHFFHPGIDPIAQARFFAGVVKANGLRPGDILVADVEILSESRVMQVVKQAAGVRLPRQNTRMASASTATVNTAAKRFLDEVARLAGPEHPVLVYTNLSVGRTLTSCTGYPLWIAFPSGTAPASVAPWRRWTFWQWGIVAGIDRDAFNGTPADLAAWIAPYLKPQFKTIVAKHVTAGQQSLNKLAVTLGTPVSTILRLTCEHSPKAMFAHDIAGYLNHGDLNALLPAGITVYYHEKVKA